MFRKLALGLIAAGSLGVAALAPTAASAGGFHHHHGHHHWGPGWGVGGIYLNTGVSSCYRERLVQTRHGLRVRVVNVEDIYAQFGGGIFDAQAIKAYIRHAVVNMGVRYVLLVGGDTYDVMPLPDGRWMLFIADVCGDGAEAASMTAVTRHTARAAAASGSPAHVLAAVNDALLREQRPGPLRFVTACCLILRRCPGGTAAQVAIAGHPAPLVRTLDAEVTALGAAGVPLGVTADVSYAEFDVRLPSDTTLLLYTDGVTEARDDDGVQFGEDRLVDVLRRTADRSADETVASVAGAVQDVLRGSRYRADDQALLAVRC